MFFAGSRYLGVGTRTVTLTDGETVTVTNLPLPSRRTIIGWHQHRESERLDVLAYRYLGDATASWAICDTNDVMDPGSLSVRDIIAIPGNGR